MVAEYNYVPVNVAEYIGCQVRVHCESTLEQPFIVNGILTSVDDDFLYVEYEQNDLIQGCQCVRESIIRFAVRPKEDEESPIGMRGMSSKVFRELLEELDGNSVKTLAEKNARYSQNGDALHNFRSGADIAGGTPAQACWGYLTKHLVALRDMVQRDDFSNREDFLEKCQDTINYIRFLWCIGNEEKGDR